MKLAEIKLVLRQTIGVLLELALLGRLLLMLLGCCLTLFCIKVVNFGLIATPLEVTLGALAEVASKSSRLVIGFILIICGPLNLGSMGLLCVAFVKSR